MKNSRTTSSAVAAKTIERLVIYRNLLEEMQAHSKVQVFSSEMARIVGNTAAQVRRDLMAIGYSGNTRNGYGIENLRCAINSMLEPAEGIAMAVVGVGNLGRAFLGYFSLLQPRFRIVAAFDSDENKVNRMICGCRIHHVRDLPDTLAKSPVQLGIITLPADHAQDVADAFVRAGVKGIVNFAPTPLHVPPGVWLENMHITATLEKVAYFSRMNAPGENV